MKLKRICAFLIMVFALSGCASDMSGDGAMVNTNPVSNTVITQLTQRENKALSSHMESVNTSLKEEVKTYATAKKLNKKLIHQEEVKDVFQKLAEASEAKQYQAPEPEVEEIVENEVNEVNEVNSDEAVAEVVSEGSFEIKTTLYGVDCYGCNVREDGTGNTATGVQLNPAWGVLQSDGTWKSGLTYDGYYIIAMDASVPFYSIVEISNHGYSGMGLSPDQPIQCIVLDRGGAITGNHVDLYIGSEQNVNQIHYNGAKPVAKILRYGK